MHCGFLGTRHLIRHNSKLRDVNSSKKDTEFFVMQSFPVFTLIQPPAETARQMKVDASRAVEPTCAHMSSLQASMRSVVIFLGYVVLHSCMQS